MTNIELRKLNRKELLELLVQQEHQNETLQAKVAELEDLLRNRSIHIENSGSIAQAALVLSGVFEAADEAVAKYKESIQHYSEEQERVYKKTILDAEQRAAEIIAAAEVEKRRKIEEADAYWGKLSQSLEEFYQCHAGLKELLNVSIYKK